jgi:A/G-specific adenine glycosylase
MNHDKLQSTRFRANLMAWFDRHGRELPWRATADPYRILVSEMMLQQTQVTTVLQYYDRWFALFPTIKALAAADEAEVLSAWEGLGYYARARHLHACARWVAEHRDGRLPCEVDELLKLPGIGRYTAGAVVSFAFDLPAPIIDANVGRVLSRLVNLESPIDREPGKSILWELAAQLVAGPRPGAFNSAIMELGALICSSRAPRCVLCPVREFCSVLDPELVPNKSPSSKPVRLQENYRWIRHEDRLLLSRSAGPRWKGLWILPPAGDVMPHEVALFELRHTVTRFQIHLRVFAGEIAARLEDGERFHRLGDIRNLPMPTPHRLSVEAVLRQEQERM